MDYKATIQKIIRKLDDLCCMVKNFKNIFNSDGTILANRTVNAEDKDLIFTSTSLNTTSFGFENDPIQGHKAFVSKTIKDGFGYIFVNTTSDVADDADEVVMAIADFGSGKTCVSGVKRIGALSDGLYSFMKWTNAPVAPSQLYEFAIGESGFIYAVNGTPVLWIHPNGGISAPGLTAYASNADAITAGLIAGVDCYVNSVTGAVSRVL